MATAEIVRDVVDIKRTVKVTFDPDERPETTGDRKRGSRLERRNARIISVTFSFVWDFKAGEWKQLGYSTSGMIEQQKADGSWSAPDSRYGVGFPGLDDLVEANRPTSRIVFEEVSA